MARLEWPCAGACSRSERHQPWREDPVGLTLLTTLTPALVKRRPVYPTARWPLTCRRWLVRCRGSTDSSTRRGNVAVVDR
jgi:hypothetical protein